MKIALCKLHEGISGSLLRYYSNSIAEIEFVILDTPAAFLDKTLDQVRFVFSKTKLQEEEARDLMNKYANMHPTFPVSLVCFEDIVPQSYMFNDVSFQIDTDSRLNIASKALSLSLDTTRSTVSWKATDNSVVEFTRDEFITFALEVESYYESLVLGS
jgi:hypothetical protein